jgi:hypothetical protein
VNDTSGEPRRRGVAALLLASVLPACVHRAKTEEIILHTTPPAARVVAHPSAVAVERRSASTVLELGYRERRPARLPLALGGVGALAGSAGLAFMSVLAAGGCADCPPGPPNAGLLAGAVVVGIGGLALLAVAAAPARPLPQGYELEITAPGFAPSRQRVTVPRRTTDRLRLELAPTATVAAAPSP